MPEVLDQNQIDSVDTEIGVGEIIDSYEQSSVENGSDTEQDQKSAPLSPDIGDYVSDPEKYELEYENSGNTFYVAEDGSVDLVRNGLSMTELMESIAADDRTSDCRSAFSDAYHKGVGVITSENETDFFVMLIVRNSEAEASWITYKSSKEEDKDVLKEKKEEELEEQPELNPILKPDETAQPEAAAEQPALDENIIQANTSVHLFESFSDFNQFMKTESSKQQIENSDVPNSVDNAVSEPTSLHESVVAESPIITGVEKPTGIIEPEISIALEDTNYNIEPSAIKPLD